MNENLDNQNKAKDLLNSIAEYSGPQKPIGVPIDQVLDGANSFIKDVYGTRVEHGSDYQDNIEKLLKDIENTKEGKVKPATGQINKIIHLANLYGSKEQIENFKESLNQKVRTEVFFTKESLRHEASKAGLTHSEIEKLIDSAFPDVPFIPVYESPPSEGVVYENEPEAIPQEVGTIPTAKTPQPSAENQTADVISAAASLAAKLGGGALGPFGSLIASKITPILIRQKQWVGAVLGFLGGSLGAGIIGVNPILGGVVIGTAGFALGSGVTGVSAAASAGAVAAHASLTALGIATIGAIVPFLIIALLVIPVVIAFILFIINSGAYMVPPSSLVTKQTSQSPYISVIKTADTTIIANIDLPKSINYTIRISAPLGSITNLEFQHDCSVLSKSGTKKCTHPTPNETPATIEPNSPYEFSYTIPYDQTFMDSVVTDTFKVNAKVADASKDENSSGSVSVVIGNPPTSCFDIQGDWSTAKYPNSKEILMSAAAVISSYTNYSAKLCSGGTIRVVYVPSVNPDGWGYYAGGGEIQLNGGGLFDLPTAVYILAHESGHHFSWHSGSAIYSQYLDSSAVTELPLCSYDQTYMPSEGFAESIALYITREQSWMWTHHNCGNTTYQEHYPANYQFANDVIFK